jgi:hypothetical protein
MVRSATLQGEDPKSYLALSAPPDLLEEDARTAALIEAWQERIERARAAGAAAAAEQLQDDLAAFVFGPWHTVTESELRLLDGNR